MTSQVRSIPVRDFVDPTAYSASIEFQRGVAHSVSSPAEDDRLSTWDSNRNVGFRRLQLSACLAGYQRRLLGVRKTPHRLRIRILFAIFQPSRVSVPQTARWRRTAASTRRASTASANARRASPRPGRGIMRGPWASSARVSNLRALLISQAMTSSFFRSQAESWFAI